MYSVVYSIVWHSVVSVAQVVWYSVAL